ncbi:hypothetical protein MUCCIDRAFT_78562 [Mucor lusitanicus CBS 277.49]|uniref:Golgi apparatus membrane protein TVP38 n=2 Tax=Mucor circinelloides f. lusitanicus TaxID=29924 RepID=A0A168NKA5_MUCCL|nr:hypothetical protein MUCCIDRAFT_78562 [Mucor lusitanicus CBS 277.49]
MTAIVCLSCVPPLMGFTLAITMCGYVYGFRFGLVPVILGANLGAISTFLMFRKLGLDQWLNSKKRYSAVSAAIQEGGFKMMLLIRLGLPWHLTNVILSTNDCISFNVYSASAFLGSFKLIWVVWLGSQMASLNNPELPPQVHRYTKISVGVSLLLMTFVGIWLYRLVMRKIKVKHDDEEEPLWSDSSNLAVKQYGSECISGCIDIK